MVQAQQVVLKKGEIMDSLPLRDTIQNGFSLYLPGSFAVDDKWPLLLVLDLKGRARQTLSMFVQAAEKQGYVLMFPRISDSLSVTENMVKIGESLEQVLDLLPIQGDRIYTAGEGVSGRFSSLLPTFFKEVHGVVSIGASMANMEVLDAKRPFHFIGIIDRDDHNYPNLLMDANLLNSMGFPNQILLHEGTGDWPAASYIEKALQLFDLSAMGRNRIPNDPSLVARAYDEDLDKLNRLKGRGDLLWVDQYMGEMLSIYQVHRDMDSLRKAKRDLGRDKQFKAMERNRDAALAKESLIRQEYRYAMEEDVQAHNFNNLGWWNHQKEQIGNYISGTDPYERQMGNRLMGFVNALAEDHIDLVQNNVAINQDALAFLYMTKTILEPDNFEYYLKTIALSAQNEDYGTALFYLEEALKRGFGDQERLYNLEGTALLRITPEFNKLVSKYLDGARYEIWEN